MSARSASVNYIMQRVFNMTVPNSVMINSNRHLIWSFITEQKGWLNKVIQIKSGMMKYFVPMLHSYKKSVFV